jgi:hypothetical protein
MQPSRDRDAAGGVPALLPAWGRDAWVLGGAYLLYLAVYTGAVLASTQLGFWWSLLWSFLYSLPEAVAAPLVLRLAGSPRLASAPPARRAAVWVLGAVAFPTWSMVVGQLCAATMGLLETGTWTFTLTSPYVAWKALTSLLIFASLAGLGVAGVRAREARAAAVRAERAETLRAEARLAVLRAQLNPHFILNVLHSLVGMAERDPALTATALERLGTTLRYALRVQSAAVDTVPLRDELEFTRDYLELERMRLGDRLETRFAVPEALLDRTVPSFTLQPLVENSIRHAIAPRSRGGVVSITVEDAGGTLSLAVEDDGPGAVSPPPRWREEAGVGLRLLRDRLDALYDGGAALELGRSPLGGFRAVIRIAAPPPDRGDGETE